MIEVSSNVIAVKGKLDGALQAFLQEAAGEVESKAQSNSRVNLGTTKNSYTHKNADESTIQIGSGLQNAIWEEYGTGEYALHGDGRKGGWSYLIIGGSKGPGAGAGWHHTLGKTPNQPLKKAFDATIPKMESYAKKTFGDI